ncbi:MAG: plastocyanin/azurin family copper-binding protein [Halobacteriales archaeon]|nr:plastocyanin/azurin family copper-binding protein [Halobacteriales archaeon]
MTADTTRRQYLRALAGTGALATALPLAGCSGGDGGSEPTTEPSGSTATVEMTDDLVFDPADIEVSAGTTVVWENVGGVGHSVTAYEDELPDGAAYFASGGFDSEEAARDNYAVGDADAGDVLGGESYSHTFETAGTYEYFCIPHESAGMVGTVTVT